MIDHKWCWKALKEMVGSATDSLPLEYCRCWQDARARAGYVLCLEELRDLIQTVEAAATTRDEILHRKFEPFSPERLLVQPGMILERYRVTETGPSIEVCLTPRPKTKLKRRWNEKP